MMNYKLEVVGLSLMVLGVALFGLYMLTGEIVIFAFLSFTSFSVGMMFCLGSEMGVFRA